MNELQRYAQSLVDHNWPTWPTHRQKAWGYGEIATLARIGNDPSDHTQYRLKFSHRSYDVVGIALGWMHDPSRSSYEAPSAQHLAMMLSQASEQLTVEMTATFSHLNPVTERISAPCLHHYSASNTFAVAAGPNHHRWLRAIGFQESAATKLWHTGSALAAAPLIRLATTDAANALKKALPGYRILKDFKDQEPIMRPWMGFDPDQRLFQIHANEVVIDRLLQIAPGAFIRTSSAGIATTSDPKIAFHLKAIAEERLKISTPSKRSISSAASSRTKPQPRQRRRKRRRKRLSGSSATPARASFTRHSA
jgi:hypothetical protein